MEEHQPTMTTIQKIARWQCRRYNRQYLYDDAVQEGWVAVCQYQGEDAVELAVKRRITRMIENEINEQEVIENSKVETRGNLKAICWRMTQKIKEEEGVVGHQEVIERLQKAGYHLPTDRTIRNWILELASEKDWVRTNGPVFK